MSIPTTKRAALPAKTAVTRSAKTSLISGAVARAPAVAVKPVVARKPAVRASVSAPAAKKLLTRPKLIKTAPAAVPSKAVIDKATTAARTATGPRNVAVAKIVVPEVPVKVAAAEISNGFKSAKKSKLVHESFSIPKIEYAVLQALKQRAAGLTKGAKKSELLRAGIKALAAMPDAAFLNALKQVPVVKTGRTAAS